LLLRNFAQMYPHSYIIQVRALVVFAQHTCFASGILLGGWRIRRASPVSMRWYTFLVLIVLVISSKDVLVLGQEFFLLLEFSVS
jgi:hypothetical protein